MGGGGGTVNRPYLLLVEPVGQSFAALTNMVVPQKGCSLQDMSLAVQPMAVYMNMHLLHVAGSRDLSFCQLNLPLCMVATRVCIDSCQQGSGGMAIDLDLDSRRRYYAVTIKPQYCRSANLN